MKGSASRKLRPAFLRMLSTEISPTTTFFEAFRGPHVNDLVLLKSSQKLFFRRLQHFRDFFHSGPRQQTLRVLGNVEARPFDRQAWRLLVHAKGAVARGTAKAVLLPTEKDRRPAGCHVAIHEAIRHLAIAFLGINYALTILGRPTTDPGGEVLNGEVCLQ